LIVANPSQGFSLHTLASVGAAGNLLVSIIACGDKAAMVRVSDDVATATFDLAS
jgi:hypothetical protein